MTVHAVWPHRVITPFPVEFMQTRRDLSGSTAVDGLAPSPTLVAGATIEEAASSPSSLFSDETTELCLRNRE